MTDTSDADIYRIRRMTAAELAAEIRRLRVCTAKKEADIRALETLLDSTKAKR